MNSLITRSDEVFMRAALAQADEAERRGEVPVGAVIVDEGEIVAAAGNAPVSKTDPTAHAEISALREAGRKMGNYRLPGATVYVTVEPCAMCAGALVAARVGKLVFGTRDLRFGAVRSKFRLADSDRLNHRIEIVEGVLAEECLKRLQAFFRATPRIAGHSTRDATAPRRGPARCRTTGQSPLGRPGRNGFREREGRLQLAFALCFPAAGPILLHPLGDRLARGGAHLPATVGLLRHRGSASRFAASSLWFGLQNFDRSVETVSFLNE